MMIVDILSRLVAFPSVAGLPNADIVAWIEEYLSDAGARVTRVPGPEGDRTNLFATLGPAEGSGLVLSGHMDVVPADEADWTSDPFVLRRSADRLHGRGACDMKGFVACMLAVAAEAAGRDLVRPLHLALSYDEENGCRGVPHLIARLPDLCAPPIGCVVGEPTGLRPVRGHKGKAAIRVNVVGRGGHSSRPDLGLNAVHGMARVLDTAIRTADALALGPTDHAFEPPHSTLQVGIVSGGRAVNVIPDNCRAEIEARAVPGIDPLALLRPIIDELDALRGAGYIADAETMSSYPGSMLPAGAPLVAMLELATGRPAKDAVSFGTEAGLFQEAGLSTIVCGPGDIDRAHKANEFITCGELEECREVLTRLIATALV